MDLAALQAKAAASSPMASAAVPILQGRTLYLDGDGLAYYCAGNDEATVAQARSRTRDKVDEMMRASRAEKVLILLTGSGGHKGHRYAIARVKPYQGQRTNSKRPKNWKVLRDLLEAGEFGAQQTWHDREADDGFGQYASARPDVSVIGTQDKDMQMVPGWHIDWKDNRMFYLQPDAYDASFNDKQYGLKWFWQQMLQGDGADNIPGLPWVKNAKGNLSRCGEVTAGTILSTAATSEEAGDRVRLAYQSYYAERWLTEMMEQACLLWMRRGPTAHWFEAGSTAGPLGQFIKSHPEQHHDAWFEINERVKQAIELNALSTESQ